MPPHVSHSTCLVCLWLSMDHDAILEDHLELSERRHDRHVLW